MSSTNRGRARNLNDSYLTPSWCVRRFLEEVYLPPGDWLEPCAGAGAIIQTVNEMIDGRINWTAVELDHGFIRQLSGLLPSDEVIYGDFLEQKWNRAPFEVAFTNPPFSLAMPFIEECNTITNHTVILLRLNFVASEERAALTIATPPRPLLSALEPDLVK